MKEKMHITVLTLGICTLMGLTFAISTKDRPGNDSQLKSSSVETAKFVCNATTMSESSLATKDYNENLEKWKKLLIKIDSLGGDAVTLGDPCEGLKGKQKTECAKENTQLRAAIQQIKKLEKRLRPYKECMEELGLLETDVSEKNKELSDAKKDETKSEKKKVSEKIKDCGIMNEDIGETVSPESQKKLACISKAITSCTPAKIAFKNSEMDDVTYMVYKKNTKSCAIGFSTNEGSSQCDIPLSTIKDLKKYGEEEDMSDFIITPIAMLIAFREGTNTVTGEKFTLTCRDYDPDNKKDTTQWSEGEWSTCTNGRQTRKVECQSDSKKVDEKQCKKIKPSTSQKCTMTDSNNDISTGKTKLYGPWVFDRQSYDVIIGDMVQFTYDLDISLFSDDVNKYKFACGKDGSRTTNPKNPSNMGAFYCVYDSSGQQTATISYQSKIIASKTFTVKEKAEQSTKKPEQKKYKCVETDEGLDYEKKGSVTGIWDFYTGDLSDPTLTTTHEDICIYGSGVLEYSCDEQGRKTSTDYMCPKGCKEGACIK